MKEKALAAYLKEQCGLLLGERTLEDLRRATVEHARKTVRVRGRSMATGRKKSVTIPLIILAVELSSIKTRS